MRVTEVKVFPVTDDKLKAFVSVVLDNCFMVNDIKVIEGRDGRFISMPSRRKRNGKFKDIAHPLNSDTRQMLEVEILGEYERLLNGDDSTEAPKRRRPRRERQPRRKAEERGQEAAPGKESDSVAPDDQPAERPEPSAAQAAERKAPEAGDEPEKPSEKTLEEVTEKHLSDSFWTS